MKKKFTLLLASFCFPMTAVVAHAGPYTDDAIAGFVGPAGEGVTATESNGNYVNPIFKAWASNVVSYQPYDLEEIQNYMSGSFSHPEKTLGPVTGSNFDIVSLGDMDANEIAAWKADPVNNPGPGELILSFGSTSIYNGDGYDFAAFENGFGSGGGIFAELGYVEVSTDGEHWARFDSVSLTENAVGGYGTIDPTDVHNLVGKHVNAYGNSWGTGFDLDDLLLNEMVLAGLVNLDEINYVKIVDIPGSGDFTDSLGNPIYDAWVTWGSGGVDFEALGVINASAVPVPSAAWLLGAGLMGLIGWKRNNRA